jgi:hypothetical protein
MCINTIVAQKFIGHSPFQTVAFSIMCIMLDTVHSVYQLPVDNST